MSVSSRTRFEVFKRDRFTCAYCGGHPPDVLLECDHIITQAAGGSDEMVNLVTSCRDCNAGKSDRLLDEGTAPAYNQASIEAMQERLEQAKAYMETLTSLQAVNDDMVFRVQEAWALAWGASLIEDGDGRHHYSFVDGGTFPSRASIKRFLRDLPLDDVLYAVDETAFHAYPGIRSCALCGIPSLDVRSGLACYADDGRFERIDRCMDHQECRDRVEASGDDWPLSDITERRTA